MGNNSLEPPYAAAAGEKKYHKLPLVNQSSPLTCITPSPTPVIGPSTCKQKSLQR